MMQVFARFHAAAAAAGLAAALGLTGASLAQAPGRDGGMESLPGLMEQRSGGTFRCADGSTRSYSGAAPSDLVQTMKCSRPEGPGPGQAAMDAKNAAAAERAALAGQDGVVEGLKATAKTGSPDFLLRFRIVWLIGLVLAVVAVGAILGRLLGARK